MGLAGTWETPDGEPTMTFFIVLGAALTLAVIGVVLYLRWHDRRQLLRERLPWTRLVAQTREMADYARQATEHLAAQVERETRIMGEIRHELTGAAADSRPHLKIVKR